MIVDAAIIAPALLTGWLGGLTLHAFRVVRWKDPGARAVWIAGAGAGGSVSLLASLAICLVTRPTPWLALLAGYVVAGAVAAWCTSERLRLRPPVASHDGSRGLRHEGHDSGG